MSFNRDDPSTWPCFRPHACWLDRRTKCATRRHQRHMRLGRALIQLPRKWTCLRTQRDAEVFALQTIFTERAPLLFQKFRIVLNAPSPRPRGSCRTSARSAPEWTHLAVLLKKSCCHFVGSCRLLLIVALQKRLCDAHGSNLLLKRGISDH